MLDIILKNIIRRKLRSGLTILGIALSIFAVIAMGGMSEYFHLTLDKSISLTADKIRVLPETGEIRGGGLNESKVMEVKRVPGVQDAYGVLSFPLDPENTGMLNEDLVFGVPPDKQRLLMKDTKLTEGRFLVTGDGYKAVVGSDIAREFKLNIGSELEIERKPVQRASSITQTKNFTVVGIMEYTGSYLDSIVQIPLDRAQRFYEQENTVSFIHAVPGPDTDPEDLAKRIELSVEKVKTLSPQEIRTQIESSLIIFSLISISTAVIAAIIGGLSAMNTMLMSVSERIKEFGLMMALGAETRDVLLMTIGEATVMGILGGILGIVCGGTIVNYLNDYLLSRGTAIFSITPRLLVIAIIFSTSLGILSGVYPAYRAAKMNPMEALRFE